MLDRIAELVTSADEDQRRQGVELAVSRGSPTTILHRIAEESRAVWRTASCCASEATQTHRRLMRERMDDHDAFRVRMETRADEIEARTRADAADAALRMWLREMQEGD